MLKLSTLRRWALPDVIIALKGATFMSSSSLPCAFGGYVPIGQSLCSPWPEGIRRVSQVTQGTADFSQTYSPAVRYLVNTHSIKDVTMIQASGPKNRLLKG